MLYLIGNFEILNVIYPINADPVGARLLFRRVPE